MSKFIGATQTATLEDKITTFTSSGTFTPVKSAVDFLVVAGGGGASSKGAGSGGGGGGGFRASWNNETSGGLGDSESTLSLTAGTDYTVIVGAGGAGSSTSSAGTKGTNSYISEQFLANDSDTEFLLHSNTTNGSTTFTDSSSAGQTITAYGNVQHSTTEQKFGTTAIKFDGSGDYLTVPSIPNFGNYSQYCIEMWINTSASSGWLLFNAPNDQGMRLSIGKNGTATDSPGKVCMNEQNNNTDHYIISTSRVDDGEWHHLAVTRGTQNQPVKLYIDGVHETTGTVANWNFDSGETLYIGRRSNNAGSEFTGYLEEIRISDDTNRYSANFVPTGTPHIECIGGGSGGGQGGAGTTGGSGGGGAYTGAGYAGTANQGFTGGTAVYFGGSEYCGGSGGGAGGVGIACVDLSPGVSGEGGPGQFTTITGRKIYYAGGGGGGSYIYGGPGARSATGGGGYGLGGDWFQGGSSRPHAYYGGTDKNGESAAANTGGGGGGGDGATNSDPSSGGAGGSGIVIAREADVNTITSGMWDMKQIYKEKLAGNWI